jgi:hypothetical protein
LVGKDHAAASAYRQTTTAPAPLASFEHWSSIGMSIKSTVPALAGLCCSFVLAAPASATCVLKKIAEMPLLELGAHYAVAVKINEVTRPMIVDTGAEVTLFKSSAADELNLPPDYSSSDLKPVLGIGQTHADLHMNVIPSVLRFGDLVYRNRSTVVAQLDFGKLVENDAVGVLGDDILSQFDVEFDFPSRKLTFYREFDCYDTFSPWTGTYATIPFDHHGAKIVIDVILNQERTRAIVDTGNNVSFVSRNSSALWDVSDDELAATKGLSTSPFNGGTSSPIRTYEFDKAKIGGQIFSKMTMNIIDVDFPLGSANLGLDYWRTRKVWISYPTNWMFISNPPLITAVAHPVKERKPAPSEAAIADNH